MNNKDGNKVPNLTISSIFYHLAEILITVEINFSAPCDNKDKGFLCLYPPRLNFKCFLNGEACPLSIIDGLYEAGWTTNDNGLVCYLPLRDGGLFNWLRESKSKSELYDILLQKEESDEEIGIVLTWKDTAIGGSFLFYPNGQVLVSFNINRITTEEGITDFNWYTEKIIKALRGKAYTIESFKLIETL